MQAVRQDVQAVQHTFHPPADPLRHPAVPLPVLREAVPPEIRHEEAHLYSYWPETISNSTLTNAYKGEDELTAK
ncbi:Uncharacterized protein OBRU01_27009 [Operophtera brumata]|uniref:Uncharacterized protein n=1 Tax=Operophtera brumata TaxID=104452 RepID=A0A0L7K2F4_OPEBR|nr:Uncharacterized protein OBRU01_27009 [Operophtera brumata]